MTARRLRGTHVRRAGPRSDAGPTHGPEAKGATAPTAGAHTAPPAAPLAPALPRAVLFHAADHPLDAIRAALDAEGVERRPLDDALLDAIVDAPEAPCALLLRATLAEPEILRRALDAAPDWVAVVALDEAAERLAADAGRALLILPDDADAERTLRVLRAAFQHAAARLTAVRAEHELGRTRNELRELTRIGMSLMTERDPDRLLFGILEQAQRLTGSDAASLYLIEHGDDAPRLRFTVATNDTLPDLPIVQHTLAVDTSSLAGYAAATGEALALDDAYLLPDDAPYAFNRSFDERFGYRTKSVLVVPMLDHRDVVVGVLQLINRKRQPSARITDEAAANASVLPYTDRELRLVRSLAGQAAVSLENSRLHREIENIFESFVKAAVTAIDQRDPTTAGHSVRVATLTCDMAETVGRVARGRYAGLEFTRDQMRELRYAALLHDFGKVGVREEVLVKAKKLPPPLQERVEARFDFIRRTIEADYFRARAELLERHGPGRAGNAMRALETEFRRRLDELDRFREAVRRANEPSVLPEKSAAILDDIARRTFVGIDGRRLPYLDDDELHYLVIPKGSLDERERREIESHVEQTYRFLTQIPWTEDLRNVAEFAYGHHEKLDGRGYPRGIKGDEIPAQTRIMTIADIFDALTASDRPYKRAVPTDRALDILVSEAREGMLDPELVEVLIESKVYEKVLREDWKEL
ncbi:MAG TPA: HD domain-containing phosphohydrolase [Longimicrobiales bacterium]